MLKLIELSNHFPRVFRTSKATFIPGRTTFSLESLPKIIESVLAIELEQCTQEHYKLHGDPMGCAYTKNRGAESCNAISYTCIDMSIRDDQKAACQVFCDLKKAFNSAHRETVVAESEIVAGAGNLMASRWDGRTYTMDGEVRGERANKGTDAGTPIAIWEFSGFMNTDKHFSGFNRKLLWSAMFSDDRSPVFSGNQVCDGSLNDALLGTWEWSKRMRCEYHLSGDKEPALLVYRNKQILAKKRKRGTVGELIPVHPLLRAGNEGTAGVKLGEIYIKVCRSIRNLGLNIATSPDNGLYKKPLINKAYVQQANSMIERFGYMFEPEIAALRLLAYRIQDSRGGQQSCFNIRLAVLSYFCGKLRFSCSLYWSRATKKQLETVRFYYAMAAAAIVGLTAYDVVGAKCCAMLSVSRTNLSMKKLLFLTELPTMLEMAVASAKVIVAQVDGMKPEWFHHANRRYRLREQERRSRVFLAGEGRYIPRYISPKCSDTLIHDIHKLSAFNVDTLHEEEFVICTGNFRNLWDEALLGWEELSNSNNSGGVSEAMFIREMFTNLCKVQLDIFGVNKRRISNRSPSVKIIENKICRVVPPTWVKPVEWPDTFKFDCSTESPRVKRKFWNKSMERQGSRQCKICGCEIKIGKYINWVKCNQCDDYIHNVCAKKLNINVSMFECTLITRPLRPGAVEIPFLQGASLPSEKICLFCGSLRLYESVCMCSKKCGHWIHTKCGRVLFTEYLEEQFDRQSKSTFSCSKVKFQCPKKDVDRLCIERARGDTLISTPDTVTTSFAMGKKRRFTSDTAKYLCDFCRCFVDHSDINHELEHCTAMSSRAAFGGINSYTPVKRARIAEYTVKRLKLEGKVKFPP